MLPRIGRACKLDVLYLSLSLLSLFTGPPLSSQAGFGQPLHRLPKSIALLAYLPSHLHLSVTSLPILTCRLYTEASVRVVALDSSRGLLHASDPSNLLISLAKLRA